MDPFTASQGTGRCRVEMTVTLTDEGLSVLLTGGERSHVGGVVLCLPRQSLEGTGRSADAWIVPVPGHKDVLAGEVVGSILAKELNEPVAVTAGIHSDQASTAEIQAIMANCRGLAAQAAATCRKLRAGRDDGC